MTGFKPGDIVLIAFPFTDFSTLKQRPAFVISSEEFNRTHPDLIVAAITSHILPEVDPSDFRLTEADLRAGGLPKASLVKLGKIVTLDQRLVRKKLGALPFGTLDKLLTQLQGIFKKA